MIVSMPVPAVSAVLAAGGPARVDLSWHPHVSVWLVFGAIVFGFWWAITRVGPTKVAPGAEVISSRQRNWLIFGIGIAYVVSEYPIHDISEKYLLLVHMIQHTVFTLVSPAAILLGTPEWLFRWIVERPVIRPVVKFFVRPIVAFVVFNSLVAGTHWVRIVEKSLHNEWVHFSVHFVLFMSALCMWMPVINRVSGYPVFTKPMKIAYLFFQSLVPMIPAAFLAFAGKAVYPTYAQAPRLIHGLTPVGDQQIAAAIMKLGGTVLLWGAMGFVFIAWWRDSQRDEADDMLLKPAPRPVIVSSLAGAGVVPAAAAAAAPVGAASLPGDDVLMWEHVQAEFERIERAGTGPSSPPPAEG